MTTEYQLIKDYIAKGRNGIDRPLANNTRYVDRGDRVAIKLHATDVVTYFENGEVEFNSGGWGTMTTKDRMSYAREFSIYSQGGTWYIYHRKRAAQIERNLRRKFGLPVRLKDYQTSQYDSEYDGMVQLGHVGPRGKGYGFFHNMGEVIGFKDAARIYRAFNRELQDKSVCLFFDGIRFTAKGKPVNALPLAEARAKVEADEALRQEIREYAKLAVATLDAGPIPMQNNGDCWYCLMRTANEQPQPRDEGGHLSYGYRFAHMKGQSLGDAMEDYGHLLDHLREGYVPTALILNAMDQQPYGAAGKGMWLGVREIEGEMVMGGVRELTNNFGTRRAHDPEMVAKAVYEFVGRRLLPGRELRGGFAHSWKFPEPELRELITT